MSISVHEVTFEQFQRLCGDFWPHFTAHAQTVEYQFPSFWYCRWIRLFL